MRTPIAPIHLAEQDLAAGELEYITEASQKSGANAWKNAVLEWHCEAVAKTRNEPWLAWLSRSHDPIVDKVLKRFYRDRVGTRSDTRTPEWRSPTASYSSQPL